MPVVLPLTVDESQRKLVDSRLAVDSLDPMLSSEVDVSIVDFAVTVV